MQAIFADYQTRKAAISECNMLYLKLDLLPYSDLTAEDIDRIKHYINALTTELIKKNVEARGTRAKAL